MVNSLEKRQAGDLVAQIRWTGNFNLDMDPELKKAVDLFTSKKGKPITRWRSKSLPDMLHFISQKSDIDVKPLMLGMLAIYEDASEALHGTIYGTIFHIGLFTSGNVNTKKQIVSSVHGQLSVLFLALGSCINSLIVAVDKVFPIKEIRERSKENLKALAVLDQKTRNEKRNWSVNIK